MSDGNAAPDKIDDCPILLNGVAKPGPMKFKAGTKYRLRLVNITAIDPLLRVSVEYNDKPVSWKAIAKDGASLPLQQRTILPAIQVITIGETRDFEWIPRQAGDYIFRIKENETEFVKMTLKVI